MTITGSGTYNDPYTINSYADLKSLMGSGYSPYAGSKYFALTTDISLDNSFTGIGSSSYPFEGHFDGQNHYLSNLYHPLVAYWKGGDIKNLVLLFCHAYPIIGGNSVSGATTLAINGNVIIKNAYLDSKSTITSRNCSILYGATNNYTWVYTLNGLTMENCYFGGNLTNCYANLVLLLDYSGATAIRNVNIKNCIFNNTNGGILTDTRTIYGVSSTSNPKLTIEGVNVDNCYIDSFGNSGFLIGTIEQGVNEVKISNCHVTNCTLYARGSNVSSMFGFFRNKSTTVITMDDVVLQNSCIIRGASSSNLYQLLYVYEDFDVKPTVKNSIIAHNQGVSISFMSKSYTSENNTITDNSSTSAGFYLRVKSPSTFNNDSPQTAPKAVDETVTFSFEYQQGAAVYLNGTTVVSGYSVSYGTGGSIVGGNPLTAKYSSVGTKTASVTLTGWNGSAAVSAGSLSTTVYIGSSSPTAKVYVSSAWHDATPQIYVGGAWHDVTEIQVYTGGAWHKVT